MQHFSKLGNYSEVWSKKKILMVKWLWGNRLEWEWKGEITRLPFATTSKKNHVLMRTDFHKIEIKIQKVWVKTGRWKLTHHLKLKIKFSPHLYLLYFLLWSITECRIWPLNVKISDFHIFMNTNLNTHSTALCTTLQYTSGKKRV